MLEVVVPIAGRGGASRLRGFGHGARFSHGAVVAQPAGPTEKELCRRGRVPQGLVECPRG